MNCNIGNICNILSFGATLILLFIEFRRGAIRIKLSINGILNNNSSFFGFPYFENYEISVLNTGDIPIYVDDYGFISKKECISCNEKSEKLTLSPKTEQTIFIERDYLIKKLNNFSDDKNEKIKYYVKVNGKTKSIKSTDTFGNVVDADMN